VATSLAVYWGDTLGTLARGPAATAGLPVYDYMVTRATAAERLGALAAATGRLTRDFGAWRTPWGDINRFQRLTGAIVPRFDDAAPSVPVPFTSARWGSLASYGARTYPGTKRMYGSYGNTFVAVVEFGRDSVRAMAVTAGGESGDPRSPHFNDQAELYASGRLRPVYFYPGQLDGHTERTYHPGDKAIGR
jgi:acyl-homoserine-lactone acylase